MRSLTLIALKEFDNQHDFERLAADVLNASGCTDVVLQAPREGADGGKDILFTYGNGLKGMAWVTLQEDINISPRFSAGLEPLPKKWVESELETLGETWRQDVYF